MGEIFSQIFLTHFRRGTTIQLRSIFWRASELGVESAGLNVNGFQYLFRIW